MMMNVDERDDKTALVELVAFDCPRTCVLWYAACTVNLLCLNKAAPFL